MALITSPEALRPYLPNQLEPGKGETSIFARLAGRFAEVETWLSDTFTGSAIFGSLATDTTDLRKCAEAVVVLEALRLAIPTLDLVATPNGFAVPQTATLAPVSASRIERLLGAIRADRSAAVGRLIKRLAKVDGWLDTPQGAYFASVLLCTPADLASVKLRGEVFDSWERWRAVRPSMIRAEDRIGRLFVSPEIMERLRLANITGSASMEEQDAIDRLRAIIAMQLDGQDAKSLLCGLVDDIRRNPAAWPEWEVSETAKIYVPGMYQNTKSSGGYFF